MTAASFDHLPMRGRGAAEMRTLLVVLAALCVLAERPAAAAGQARVHEYTATRRST